jgi:hypothetical protein
MDMTSILDFIGATKEIGLEDGSTQKMLDKEAFAEKMQDIAKVSQELGKVEKSPGLLRQPQVNSSPAPMAAQLPNPIMPQPSGYMQAIQSQMQQPTGGIGAVPSMEQILKALQSRSY